MRAAYRFLKTLIHSLRLRQNLVKRRVYLAGLPRVSRKNRIVFRGNDVYIGYDCHIGANVEFGSKVLIASSVSFVGGDHRWNQVGKAIMDGGRDELKDILIGDDVWIGHGAIVLQGVKLGQGCIVGAGSVVTRDVASYAIVAGNPAVEIHKRFSPEQIEQHRSALGLNDR